MTRPTILSPRFTPLSVALRLTLTMAGAALLPSVVAVTTATTARGGQTTVVGTAGMDQHVVRTLGSEKPVLLNTFEVGSSYVGATGFQNQQFGGSSGRPSRSYGEQDESHYYVEYARRIHLVDRLYLKLGASYDRFDFGVTRAPLPTSLQSATATIGLQYIVRGRPAVYFQTNPGVFYSDAGDVTWGSFDAPTVLASSFPIAKNIFGVAGIRVTILGQYPVFPILGGVWIINDKFRLEAIAPEPRLIYNAGDKLDLFIGAELLGDSYRRDSNDRARPQDQRYNHAVLDYSEERVNAGFTYTPVKHFDIDVAAGAAVNREFNYYRGPGKRFRSDDVAPYAKIALKAEW